MRSESSERASSRSTAPATRREARWASRPRPLPPEARQAGAGKRQQERSRQARRAARASKHSAQQYKLLHQGALGSSLRDEESTGETRLTPPNTGTKKRERTRWDSKGSPLAFPRPCGAQPLRPAIPSRGLHFVPSCTKRCRRETAPKEKTDETATATTTTRRRLARTRTRRGLQRLLVREAQTHARGGGRREEAEGGGALSFNDEELEQLETVRHDADGNGLSTSPNSTLHGRARRANRTEAAKRVG